MTESSMAKTLQHNFSNNQAHPQDYYVYSGNNGYRTSKESYYDVPKLFNSALKWVARHAKEKTLEMVNALNLNQTRVCQKLMED